MASKPIPIRKSSDYKLIASQGKRIRATAWLQLNILSSEDGSNYYGVTVSRKVGSAVTRNRLKRWVRNCVRTEKWPKQFNAKKIVFVFRPQSAENYFKQLKYQQFLEAFAKFEHA